jgi:hypothetical protein
MAIHGPERSPPWLCRLDGLTKSLITSSLSPFTVSPPLPGLTVDLSGGLTGICDFSPFTFSLPLSPLTNHFSPITAALAALAVRLQDLFLILSQCVDLGLLSITAAFSAARDLKEILGSGFEMIRINTKAPWGQLGRLPASCSHRSTHYIGLTSRLQRYNSMLYTA